MAPAVGAGPVAPIAGGQPLTAQPVAVVPGGVAPAAAPILHPIVNANAPTTPAAPVTDALPPVAAPLPPAMPPIAALPPLAQNGPSVPAAGAGLWRVAAALPPVNAILVTPDGIVWAATEGGLARYQAGAWTILRPGDGRFPAANATALAHDGRSLWIGTFEGLFRTEDGSSFRKFGRTDGLIHDMIWSLAWDARNGILWVGTQAGLSFLSNNVFQGIDKKISNGGLSDIWVGSVLQKDRFVLCGNDDGLSIWDATQPAANPTAWVTLDMYTTNLTHNWIMSLLFHQESVWAGTPQGLCRLKNSVESLFQGTPARWEVYNRARGLAADRVNAVVSHGTAVWAGTGNGLSRVDRGQIRNLGMADGLLASDVRTLAAAGDLLWVGTSGGIQALDPARVN